MILLCCRIIKPPVGQSNFRIRLNNVPDGDDVVKPIFKKALSNRSKWFCGYTNRHKRKLRALYYKPRIPVHCDIGDIQLIEYLPRQLPQIALPVQDQRLVYFSWSDHDALPADRFYTS